MALLDEADAYVDGLDLSEEPAARTLDPDPECVTKLILELHLAKADITSIDSRPVSPPAHAVRSSARCDGCAEFLLFDGSF
jgi:hypothetical protein